MSRSRSPRPGCKHPVYTVATDGPAQQQIDALPAAALADYAELRVILEAVASRRRPAPPGVHMRSRIDFQITAPPAQLPL